MPQMFFKSMNKEELTQDLLYRAKRNGWIGVYRHCPDHGAYYKTIGKSYCCDAHILNLLLLDDFAKALFGDQIKPRYKYPDSPVYVSLEEYKFQQQQAIVQRDVLGYLTKTIK